MLLDEYGLSDECLIMSASHRKFLKLPEILGCSPVSHAVGYNLALASPQASSLISGSRPLYSSCANRCRASLTHWFSMTLFGLSSLPKLPTLFLSTWETSLFLSLEVIFSNLWLLHTDSSLSEMYFLCGSTEPRSTVCLSQVSH